MPFISIIQLFQMKKGLIIFGTKIVNLGHSVLVAPVPGCPNPLLHSYKLVTRFLSVPGFFSHAILLGLNPIPAYFKYSTFQFM